jgi:hypothetical protein
MAFNKNGLNLTASSKAGQAPQFFTYRTNDAAGAVDGSGYFNDVASILRVGDLVYVHAEASATTPTYGLHVVVSNTNGVVDVTNAVALGTVNSD